MSEVTLRKGWTRVAFGDVVRQVMDRVDPRRAGLERYVAGEHMDTDDLRIRRWGSIGVGYLGPAFNMRFRPGQVLYGSRRTYLRKVAVAHFEGITANTTFVIEPKDAKILLPELLPFIMQTESFHEHSIKQSKGSVNPYVNFSDLTWYQFALPPIEEQQRIALLLAASSHGVETLKELRAHTSHLLEATIEDVAEKAAVSGSLIPLGDLVEANRPITYGILKPGTGFPGGIPVVKVKNFPDGRIEETGLLLTDPRIDEEYRRSRLREGDLLISIRGTIGRLAFVPASLAGANITQDTARLSLRRDNDPAYVRAMLGSRFVQRQIIAFTTGLAVKGINIGELRQVMVPITDREHQVELMHEVAAIRKALEAGDQRLEALSAMHAAMLNAVTKASS